MASILDCESGDDEFNSLLPDQPEPRMRINLLKTPCMVCGRILTQGEWEATGVCSTCYWKAIDDANQSSQP